MMNLIAGLALSGVMAPLPPRPIECPTEEVFEVRATWNRSTGTPGQPPSYTLEEYRKQFCSDSEAEMATHEWKHFGILERGRVNFIIDAKDINSPIFWYRLPLPLNPR